MGKPTDAHVPPAIFFCLGFVGPRRLDGAERQLAAALDEVARGLAARLERGRAPCLVGSLAAGADLAIAEVLLAHGACLRALLPEPLDRFANEADFEDPADRRRVAALVERPETCEVRVVSSSADRRERFAECALAIVHGSDALLCVRHWNATNGRGGTEETLAVAGALGKPVVEICLDPDPVRPAVVAFPSAWPTRGDAGALPFTRPRGETAVSEWKAQASREAGRGKLGIVRAAAWTVGLQLGATLFALLTFEKPAFEVASLLVKISVLLTAGAIALSAARRGMSVRWTSRRFAAELSRSWNAVRGFPFAASWLEEELPSEFQAHGRDLALLHGLERGPARPEALPAFKAGYARERLGGQRAYAERSARTARRAGRILHGIFYGCLGLTLLALFVKLWLKVFEPALALDGLDQVAGLVSILGPALGAAAVSFVSLFDLGARRKTQGALADFLAAQEVAFTAATDWTAARDVVVATERRVIGESRAWYARHRYRK